MNPMRNIMKQLVFCQTRFGRIGKACLGAVLLISAIQSARAADAAAKWEPCGWGGGGFYWAVAYHPTQKGVIYLGGDVAGVYKTEDNARTWRLINNGLSNYGIYSLAVDQKNPNTVYAATLGGLAKSTDGGEHWQLLPNTGPKELRITGERNRSIRTVAVSPADGNIVYAASPGGKVYKSTDGGQSWKTVFEKKLEPELPGVLYVKCSPPFAGIFFGVKIPAGLKSEDCAGFGFSIKGDKSEPIDAFVVIKNSDGVYRSKNLSEFYKNDGWQDVVLTSKDFSIEPIFAKENREKATTIPVYPNFSTMSQVNFNCNTKSGVSACRLSKFFLAVTRSPDGKTGTATKPILLTVKDFLENKAVQTYGSIYAGNPEVGPAYSVAVSTKAPALVIVATASSGLILSEDAGQTWREMDVPKSASNAVIDPSDPNIIYGAFFTDGIRKSIDKGKTWTNISEGLAPNFAVKEVAVSPENSQNVYAIGAIGWGGGFYLSNDGGKTWKNSSSVNVDAEGDPTYCTGGGGTTALSIPTNLAINPFNPKELFISANWRNVLSEDGGTTWNERNRGADITCVTDIRFSEGRTYVSAMDEGTFVSEDNGLKWNQLWPHKYSTEFTGHNWRVAVTNIDGDDRIIGTCSPWGDTKCARVVVSTDGGFSFKVTTTGLPNYVIRNNTMWGAGYPRALSVDPKNPKTVYLGIDGDPSVGKKGGGIFKSEDGGYIWDQLPNQPSGRRMFYGLMVDPTDSKRIFWGACGSNGGVHRSEDGGASWKKVFSSEDWIYNLLVTNEGVVYATGKNVWRSTDHGTTWKKLTSFSNDRTIVGLEADPRDSKTLWISVVTWDVSSQGAVLKTTDGGTSWKDITGDLPYVKPLVLRFNPKTSELWAGGVTLHKLKQ